MATEVGSFRSLGTLRSLNVLAVGASLAAATGALLGLALDRHDGTVATLTSLTTLVFGSLWAFLLLRTRLSLDHTKWASIPLAMLNSSVACGLLQWLDDLDQPLRFSPARSPGRSSGSSSGSRRSS